MLGLHYIKPLTPLTTTRHQTGGDEINSICLFLQMSTKHRTRGIGVSADGLSGEQPVGLSGENLDKDRKKVRVTLY